MNGKEPYLDLIEALSSAGIRFVIIGVSAANYYARSATEIIATQDRDLFLPPDAANLLQAWRTGRRCGYELWAGNEPLVEPIDLALAERVVANRATTSATHGEGVTVDYTLEMAGFEFDRVMEDHRVFRIGSVEIPVARLSHVVDSKRRLNRPKDRLFLEIYKERLEAMLDDEES